MSQAAPGGTPKPPTPPSGSPKPVVPPKPASSPPPAAAPATPAAAAGPSEAQMHGRLLRSVLDIEVPLVAALCERNMTVEGVRNLTTGSVIEFSRSYDEPLDLLIGDVRIGSGEPVTVHEKFGLRIQSIGSVRERIRKLGGV